MNNIMQGLFKRLRYPHTYSSDAYVKYLQKKGCSIGENTIFVDPKSCWVDLGRLEYIKIGSNCCLSSVSLMAHDYSWYVLARSHNDILPDGGGKITIGNNVFVGYHATILKNCCIGNNVIIGACSLVTKDIPDNSVWAGTPAKMISTLDDYYEKLKESRLESAKYRARVLYEHNKRYPKIEEMGFLSYLFLPRTKENYNKYLKILTFNGIKNASVIENIFLNSRPYYDSFDDFLNDTFKII